MILISHRGNLVTRDSELENSPSSISKAISLGFDVEIDIRSHEGKIYLGHDKPDYEFEKQFVYEHEDYLWVHCKDKYALEYALDRNLNCFFHKNDSYTLTSKGFIWAYPGIESAGPKTISVLPEIAFDIEDLKNMTYGGYCSDIILEIKRKLDV